jgi:hypothetical protein
MRRQAASRGELRRRRMRLNFGVRLAVVDERGIIIRLAPPRPDDCSQHLRSSPHRIFYPTHFSGSSAINERHCTHNVQSTGKWPWLGT